MDDNRMVAAGVTVFLVVVVLVIAIGGITQDANKHKEKMAMIEQGITPPKSGFHLNVQIGTKKKQQGRPKFWKITQDEEVWYASKYDGVDGRLWLLDGRMVDLDGDFRAEEVWFEMLPEEIRKMMLPEPPIVEVKPDDYGIRPKEDLR